MKKFRLLFLIFFITINSFGQTCKQEEVKIIYKNGFEVFNICKSNPSITFDDNKEYYWYTEFSKIKSTEGGSGGNLLNGNFKFYDDYENFRIDKNYTLGLEDGNDVHWDSSGNITFKNIYNKGKIVYQKFLNDEKYWIEFNGPMF